MGHDKTYTYVSQILDQKHRREHSQKVLPGLSLRIETNNKSKHF